MRLRRLKAGVGATIALSLAMVMVAQTARAEYAPSFADVVGIGSDTVQYAMDFLADGFITGAQGYNGIGNLNRLANFDATADANARVAYGNNGIGSGQCHPGQGAAAGTGNQTADHANNTCFLNPTIVLRAGLSPVLRPNGSGAGFDAFRRDVDGTHHWVDYTRSSVCQGAGTGCRGKNVTGIDSVQLGNDPFAILVADTTNSVPLSASQLKLIYEANTPNCLKWNDPAIGGASANAIIPIVPQTASGTYSAFASSVGITTLGNCGVQFEENDPTAISAVSSSADAIMPMSGGRLNLFKGLLGNGASNGLGGFFQDPSCALEVITPAPACTTGATISPAVHLVTTGTPTGTPAPGVLWNITRPLYVYFRDSDVANTAPYGTDKPFQPGSTLNWVRTLFYNPCSAGQTGCVTVGGTQYGPGGKPYIATTAGQALISDAGIAPTYVVTLNGP
jgi:ABC-type phosphate transport system substrate-binding protein